MDSVQHHCRAAPSDSGQFLLLDQYYSSHLCMYVCTYMLCHLMKGIKFVQATIEAGLIPPLINILQKVSVGGSSRSGDVNLYVLSQTQPCQLAHQLYPIICTYMHCSHVFDLTKLTSCNKLFVLDPLIFPQQPQSSLLWCWLLTCWSTPDSLLQGEYRAQKEAAWAITNLTAGGNVQQVRMYSYTYNYTYIHVCTYTVHTVQLDGTTELCSG